MSNLRPWHWPNLIALDAALIAVAWQALFAQQSGFELHFPVQMVLGLSVWLTYMADRLFDVAKRQPTDLHSARHQFAKKYFKQLWIIWASILIGDIALALSQLSLDQLKRGGALLAICLLYTILNQLLSKRFFPKEICVALIYTGGIIAFLPPHTQGLAVCTVALLCLINCLIIGEKERAIDTAMQVRSMTSLKPKHQLTALFLLSIVSTACLETETLRLTCAAPLVLLAILQFRAKQIQTETFRTLADGALLLCPAIALLVGH